jgi:membrane protein required for colicin V production
VIQEPEPGLLEQLGWIDITAIAILAVFLILGLFRGFIWQLSRIVTLVLAYVCAGAWGGALAVEIRPWFASDLPPELPLYIAYFAIFLLVLIVVSVITHYLDKLVERSGMSFYNRVGGALLGIATGAAIVIAFLGTILMFFGREGSVVQAAEKSRSLQYSRRALQGLGTLVPSELRQAFGLEPPPADPQQVPSDQAQPSPPPGAPGRGEPPRENAPGRGAGTGR